MAMTSDDGQVTFGSSRAVLDNPHHLRLFLQRMRNDANTHDVIFVVNGEHFPAHRSLMCAASPVIRSMLTNGMKESKQTKIELREVDVDAWKCIVDYIYAAQVDVVNVDHALKVLESACRFQIDELERGLSEYVMEQVVGPNCCKILSLADRNGLMELRKKAMEVLAKNFHDVCLSVEFTGLSHEIVWDIVKCRSLIVCGEIHVFLGIMLWLLSSDDIEGEDVVHSTITKQALDLLKEVDLEVDGFSDEGKGMLRLMHNHAELLQCVDIDNLSNVDNRRVARFCREFYAHVKTVHNIELTCIRQQAERIVEKFISSPNLALCTPIRPMRRVLHNRYCESITFRQRFHGIQQLITTNASTAPVKSVVLEDRQHQAKWWLEVYFRGYPESERDQFLSCYVYSECADSEWKEREAYGQLFVTTSLNDDPIESPEFDGNLASYVIHDYRKGWGRPKMVPLRELDENDSILVGFTLYFKPIQNTVS